MVDQTPPLALDIDGSVDPADASLAETTALESGEPGHIALIGMAGRFPGAPDIDAFWDMLREGRDGLIPAFVEDIGAGPVIPFNHAYKDDPGFVSRVYGLTDKARFDAAFFGISPREAELMDPQQRIFLETAWAALEHACVIPDETTVPVGVYAACGFNAYLFNNLPGVLGPDSSMSRYLEVLIGNDKDYLATRTSYKLRLTGPSVVVQSTCSSSLSAVILACQALRDYQCDMALAGGSSIQMNQDGGYLPEEGSPLSFGGATRAFDEAADGVAGGSGCAAVVLKRYDDALADGDVIYGVIRGYGLNNDGADKVNFTAPSVSGQSKAIAEAIAEADIDPAEIGYIECHGTGTALGDPIEIAGLSKALGTQGRGFAPIPIGSVKTNVGHLDTAAGVTALIKAALALHHEQIPPSLNFTALNPKIDLPSAGLEVCATRRDWARSERPRYAAVSSFGFGGTNTHVILQEGPARPSPRAESVVPVILPVSARDDRGVTEAGRRLAGAASQAGLDRLGAVLQNHRKRFDHRGVALARSVDEARTILASGTFIRGEAQPERRRLIFQFPGQGCQYPGMGRDLYAQDGVFTKTLDRLLGTARDLCGRDLHPILFPAPRGDAYAEARAAIDQTEITHLAVFAVSYALARQVEDWGIRPDAVLGHSLGEYAAACLAGVMTETSALTLVARRGALSASLAFDGAMISVPLSRDALDAYAADDLDVAVVNGPERLTLTGPRAAIESLDAALKANGVEGRILRIANAFHCRVLDPILDDFRAAVAAVPLSPPTLPLLSNSTGGFADPDVIVTPDYWVQQFRNAVLFSDNLEAATEGALADGAVLVEIGPGSTLTSLARQHPKIRNRGIPCINVLPGATDAGAAETATSAALQAVASLWTLGVEPDWAALPGAPTGKAGLPGYPFAGERYWHQPPRALRGAAGGAAITAADPVAERASIDDWFMAPTWVRAADPPALHPGGTWLLLSGPKTARLAAALGTRLRGAGVPVTDARIARQFAEVGAEGFAVRPGEDADFAALLKRLAAVGRLPDTVLSFWPLEDEGDLAGPLDPDHVAELQATSVQPTVSVMRHAAALGRETLRFTLIARQLFDVTGESIDPAARMLLAPLLTAGWEHPGFTGAVVDIGQTLWGETLDRIDAASEALDDTALDGVLDRLLAECQQGGAEGVSGRGEGLVRAWRGRTRWVQDYAPTPITAPAEDAGPDLSGPCLITGGFGGVGLAYARLLADRGASPLVLVGRTVPPRDSWPTAEAGSAAAALHALETETKAVVVPIALDCADATALAAIVERIRREHGPLSGVVHAAGVPGGGIIASGLPEGTASNFHAKVGGLAALDTALADTPLRFFHLTSSLGAIQGAFGQTDNCAANLVLDGFAAWARWNRPWAITSVNWDRWQQVGMAKAVEDRHAAMTGKELRSALPVDDALEAARRLIGHPGAQIVVSNRDPFALTRLLKTEREEVASDGPAQATGSRPTSVVHARPSLNVPYVAPRSETEHLLAELWSWSLGVSDIGVNDDFMRLGGDSLLAIALMGRTRKAFRMDIPLRTLFETRTIGVLGQWLAEHEASPGRTEKIAAAVRQVRAARTAAAAE